MRSQRLRKLPALSSTSPRLRASSAAILYPTSKVAVIQMTRAMATHHGTEGIRVNCIAPGMVYTPMVYSRGMTPEQREARRLGRRAGSLITFVITPAPSQGTERPRHVWQR